jgi:hypothetical protein
MVASLNYKNNEIRNAIANNAGRSTPAVQAIHSLKIRLDHTFDNAPPHRRGNRLLSSCGLDLGMSCHMRFEGAHHLPMLGDRKAFRLAFYFGDWIVAIDPGEDNGGGLRG